MQRAPELRCSSRRRRRNCNAAAMTPPELRCSGRRSCTAELRCSGRQRRLTCSAEATTLPELPCSGRRSCDAAVVDAAGPAVQRPRGRRSCDAATAGVAMQRVSMLGLRQLDSARSSAPRGCWNLEHKGVTSGRCLPHGAAHAG